MSFARALDLPALLANKSHFLFGPRGVGKSTLIRSQLPNALVLNLLRSELHTRLLGQPHELEALIDAGEPKQIVVIDEVQKIPALLDEVHRLIEERKTRFLLTGSSARKLRHGGANLLAGRAFTATLGPLTYDELTSANSFELDHYLRYGGLPAVVTSTDPQEELYAYADTYLVEEIRAEGLVRKLPAFARFLQVAALNNGQMLNYAQIASDAQAPASSVKEYFQILEDTLIGFTLPAWRKSVTRKAITTAKFYFFDPGVTHTLAQTKTIDRNSDVYGRAFEQFIGGELRAYNAYRRKHLPLAYWRSTHGFEVDFTLGDELAVEVKAARRVTSRDARGLAALREEKAFKRHILVAQDPQTAKSDGIEYMPYDRFLNDLWADKLV